MYKYKFFMLKYYFHIVDNELDSEYDYEGYFSDHEEAIQFIGEHESVGNEICITHMWEWIPADDVPYDLEGWFDDIEKEERRFWDRYLNGELGVVPIGIVPYK